MKAQPQPQVDQELDRRVQQARRAARPRKKLPIILFLLTCLSTFWVAVYSWVPPSDPFALAQMDVFLMDLRIMLIQNWGQGLWYMACVLSILLLHEFGHYLMTVFYRVPATVPIFLPFPLNPIGTLGAVIGMEGSLADRKQIFDIGIAGPLAGLIVAIPLALVGLSQLDLTAPAQGGIGFPLPVLMQWMVMFMEVEGLDAQDPVVWINQLNPFFVAAWVGLVITGLNMMPVGQLDGGHVTYTVFGGVIANRIAQLTVILAVAFMVYYQHFILVVMVLLVLVIGTRHPPTADDSVELGLGRTVLGIVSLSIPVLCFPPFLLRIVG